MEPRSAWHARPVFITSTFRDMHAERDYLRTRVFPELEERLRKRRHHLEPIDLRWGVETLSEGKERARELLVLKVCLNEVERSRPFLIGLLGDRYGWVPPEERMEAAAREAGFDASVAGKSITELEIDFGVLSSPEQRLRCFFYFREPLPYDQLLATGQMDPSTAAWYSERHNPSNPPEAVGKLEALKERIQTELPERWRTYEAAWDSDRQTVTGLEAWGEQVLEDLWRELDAETAAMARRPEPTWQETERWTLESFIEDRTRHFVGREQLLDDLEAMATSPSPVEGTSEDAPWGACVTGEAGTGKSALFAALRRRLAGTDALVLAHASGISPRAQQVDAMLRRWTGELAEALDVPNPLTDKSPRSDDPLGEEDPFTRDDSAKGATAEDVEDAFQQLLGQASTERRVVVLLDALDQFEPTTRARYLTYLPRLWPPNARLVATAIPGTASEAMLERPGTSEQDIPPLSTDEAAEIAQAVCRRYHRSLHPEVLAALTEKWRPDGEPAATNPLWLELAVEELNLLDADAFARTEQEFTGSAEERLHRLLLATVDEMPPTVEALYTWMIGRAEKLFGKAWTQAFLHLIAVSRAGWRESDLRVLMPRVADEPWDEVRFAALRRTFRAHVVQRGAQAQWDFAHAQMRRTIEQQERLDDEDAGRLHGMIADYLFELPGEDPLHETEQMVHLVRAGDRERAARYYGGPLTEGEADGATQALVETIVGEKRDSDADALGWVLSLPDAPSLDEDQTWHLCNRFLFDLWEALEHDVPLHVMLRVGEATQETLQRLAARDPGNATWQRDLAASHFRVGDVRQAQGDLTEALLAYQQYRAIAQHLAAQDPGNVAWQRDLAVSHERVGNLRMAQGDLAAALEAYQDPRAIAQQLAAKDPGNAAWQRDLAVSHEKLGNVRVAQGDLDAALEAYQEALGIAEQLAARDPGNTGWQRDLAVSHEKLGNVRVAQGNLNDALEAYQQSRAIHEQLAARDPGNAAWQRDLSVSYNKVGDVRREQGDLTAALEAYRDSRAIREQLAARDPGNAARQHDLSVSYDKVGDLRREQGDLTAALEAYQQSRAIIEQLVDRDPGNAAWQHNLGISQIKVGDVRQAQGDLDAALKAYQENRVISERLAARDSGNATLQRELAAAHAFVGDGRKAQGDLDAALEAYQQYRAIAQHLAAQDSGNAPWQRDLSISHEKIGDVRKAQGDLDAALEAYQQSRAIRERLAAQDPGNAPWQRDLSVSHVRVGDVQQAQGDLDAALEAYRDSRAIIEQLAARDPGNATWQHDLAISQIKVGELREAQGALTWALQAYQEGRLIFERLAARDSGNTAWINDLAISHERVGDVRQTRGDLGAALTAYEAYRDSMQRLAARDPDNATWQRNLVVSNYKLANTLGQLGADQDAAEYRDRCYKTLQHMLRAGMYLDSPLQQILAQLEASTSALSSTSQPQQYPEDEDLQPLIDLNEQVEEAYRQGQYEEALTLAEQAHQLMDELPDLAHPACAQCLNNLGALYSDKGDLRQAQTLLLEALDLWEQIPGSNRHPGCAESLYNLGDLYRKAGYLAEAEPLYQQSLAVMRNARGDDHPDTLHVQKGLESLRQALDGLSEGTSEAGTP